jgi:hypothetical protein
MAPVVVLVWAWPTTAQAKAVSTRVLEWRKFIEAPCPEGLTQRKRGGPNAGRKTAPGSTAWIALGIENGRSDRPDRILLTFELMPFCMIDHDVHSKYHVKVMKLPYKCIHSEALVT